ncbi:MAG: 4a-hydroxytetrahydrobiopterin dehydratase [Microbacterium sp.]|uniref:VOC family protein n=1 Tax=Microbacterium sp. TaxID=51671 RepID=UPI001AD46967|nr:VOC family protein [Microbacterium sp.]MBN9153632.1 4a-hydroxytetrahydrobiopterin dehydratase [Microbacterium sp.]
MTDDSITPAEFHSADGVEGWHVLYGGVQAHFPTGSFARGAALVAAVGEIAAALGLEPEIDLRPEGVTVRSSSLGPVQGIGPSDIELARRVSLAAGAVGSRPDDTRLHTLGIAVAQGEGADTRDFWLAVLGYVRRNDAVIIDPHGRGPRFWFDEVRSGATGRGRTHVDVAVPNEHAEARVAAAVAAGGRVAIDEDAPNWWGLASSDNHSVDIAGWVDVWDGR